MMYKVLTSTKDMDRETWLKARRRGVGGSDVSAILGVNKYRSAIEVYLDKTGQIASSDPINEAAYWGNVLEDVVAKEFSKRTGLKVRQRHAIMQSIEHPYMLANVDRLIVGEEIGLECKTASEYLAKEWEEEEIPAAYILQCQHYMAVTGYKSWYIAVLIGGNKFKYKLIQRDEELIQVIQEACREFWCEHIMKLIPPMYDGSRASSNLLNTLYPEGEKDSEIELSSDADSLIRDYEEAKENEKQWAELKKTAENRLKGMLGEFETGQASRHLVTWKTVYSNRIDSKLLKEKYPEIYEECIKESVSRRFNITN